MFFFHQIVEFLNLSIYAYDVRDGHITIIMIKFNDQHKKIANMFLENLMSSDKGEKDNKWFLLPNTF
jgi:hypothetical protein